MSASVYRKELGGFLAQILSFPASRGVVRPFFRYTRYGLNEWRMAQFLTYYFRHYRGWYTYSLRNMLFIHWVNQLELNRPNRWSGEVKSSSPALPRHTRNFHVSESCSWPRSSCSTWVLSMYIFSVALNYHQNITRDVAICLILLEQTTYVCQWSLFSWLFSRFSHSLEFLWSCSD